MENFPKKKTQNGEALEAGIHREKNSFLNAA
jgi:hypothetical protein